MLLKKNQRVYEGLYQPIAITCMSCPRSDKKHPIRIFNKNQRVHEGLY
jgi:hypothetical protein